MSLLPSARVSEAAAVAARPRLAQLSHWLNPLHLAHLSYPSHLVHPSHLAHPSHPSHPSHPFLHLGLPRQTRLPRPWHLLHHLHPQ